jgi:hypothetical protein
MAFLCTRDIFEKIFLGQSITLDRTHGERSQDRLYGGQFDSLSILTQRN